MRLEQADSKSGVSTVIAVILIIAITVALVAALTGQLFQFPELISTPIQANILVDQSTSFDQTINGTHYNVTITVDDMGNADKLTVQSPTGVRTELTKVGEKITFNNLEPSETIEVIATKGGETQLLRQIKIDSNTQS